MFQFHFFNHWYCYQWQWIWIKCQESSELQWRSFLPPLTPTLECSCTSALKGMRVWHYLAKRGSQHFLCPKAYQITVLKLVAVRGRSKSRGQRDKKVSISGLVMRNILYLRSSYLYEGLPCSKLRAVWVRHERAMFSLVKPFQQNVLNGNDNDTTMFRWSSVRFRRDKI